MSKLRRSNFIKSSAFKQPVIEKKWVHRHSFKTPKDIRTISQLNKIYSRLSLINKQNFFYVFRSAFKRQPNFPVKNLIEINKALSKLNPLFIEYLFKYTDMLLTSNLNKIDLFSSNISKITEILTKFEFTRVSFNYDIVDFKNFEVNKKLNEYIKYLIKTNEIEKKSISLILKEVERLKANLLNTKLSSSTFKKECSSTYSGFLRVLNSKTPYFIKIKNKLYLGKSEIGKASPKEGFNKLLLDLETLDVYRFKINESGKFNLSKPVLSFKNMNGLLNISLENYLLDLKENYINFYKNRVFKTEAQREKAIKRIQDIFSDKRINDFIK